MMYLARSFLALMLSLALALYGAAAGASVAPAGDLTEMVICGEGGATTIWLDAEGQPAKAPQKCCKCMKCMESPANAAPQAQTDASVRRALPFVGGWVVAIAASPNRTTRPMPRGPPMAQTSQVFPRHCGAVSFLASLEFRQVSRGEIVRPIGHFSEDAR